MASPLLAMIGAITLGLMGIIAGTALVILCVQGGVALAKLIWR